VLVFLLHLLSVLFMATYKGPREINRMAGFLLFLPPFFDRSWLAILILFS
jgi:quinol-cytochrome oxidoreductase complex cytochrome b subunit